LAVALLASADIGLAALAERWGSRFRDRGALELSLTLEPWRLPAMFRLANQLKDAALAGNVPRSAVHEIVARGVSAHPWDPIVRLWAAGVEDELGEDERAIEWLERQREVFPSDATLVEEAIRQVRET
jgi:hypothetical protein